MATSSLFGDTPDLHSFLQRAAAEITQATTARLPDAEPRSYLYDLMRDYPQRGGKRFRPALVLLCTEWLDGNWQEALPAAVALELFHNFALVHDDIEDSSLFRRGQPTLHRQHGVPLALNAGDSLFGLVWEVLLELRHTLGADRCLALQGWFAHVFRVTFEGQAYDIGWGSQDYFPTRQEYFEMIRRKTGMYSGRGPCEAGALLAQASADLRQQVGRFGEALGIGFQIRDDVLNLRNAAAEQGGYGKEYGGDIMEGKRTLITIHLFENLSAADAQRLRSILLTPAAQTQDADIRWAIEQAEATGALQAAADTCQAYAEQARDELKQLPEHPARAILFELVDFLTLDREL